MDDPDGKKKFEKFFDFVKKLCGDPKMKIDPDVYSSESNTGHNNRALAWTLHADGIFFVREKGEQTSEDIREREVKFIEGVLNNYFKQCSILVTCKHLARAASVLANGGIDPKSDKRLLQKKNVIGTISLMSTCGLYDGSGEFAYKIGMAGKKELCALSPELEGLVLFPLP